MLAWRVNGMYNLVRRCVFLPLLRFILPLEGIRGEDLTIVREFMYEDIHSGPGGPNGGIHRLGNIIILSSTLHVLFDKPKLWFEATVTPSRFPLRRTCSESHSELLHVYCTIWYN